MLAEVLASPLEDPMSPEWVAVPTAGMRRWLALELARSLGASAPGAGDGISANIEFTFPGALREAVLASETDERVADPWQVDCLVWAVLEVLRSGADDERLGPLTVLPPGATWYGRARRLADLFDRYAVRRPELLLAWSAGHDLDATGRPLAAHDSWQPHLWRLVRATVAVPSPPERMPELLDKLRTGTISVALPARLAVFGVTTLPSGAPFIELIEALSVRRDLHLLLLDPSRTATARVRKATTAGPDSSQRCVLTTVRTPWWAIRCCDLGGARTGSGRFSLSPPSRRGLPVPVSVGDGDEAEDDGATSLLARLQRDLRADRAPTGDFDLDPSDRSIQVHSCHGPARQVQVLRDAILHLLADDPTLREEDIVVLCPAIGEFAALVEAGFGISAEEAVPASDSATPRLLYRITDRSLRDSSPVVAALDSLLALLSGRFAASEVLEFIALPAVRRRFEFDSDALRTIVDWIEEANVRWGLDGPHRAPWGFPAEFGANSWRAALDRLLMGVAVSDDDLDLAPGEIAPLGSRG